MEILDSKSRSPMLFPSTTLRYQVVAVDPCFKVQGVSAWAGWSDTSLGVIAKIKRALLKKKVSSGFKTPQNREVYAAPSEEAPPSEGASTALELSRSDWWEKNGISEVQEVAFNSRPKTSSFLEQTEREAGVEKFNPKLLENVAAASFLDLSLTKKKKLSKRFQKRLSKRRLGKKLKGGKKGGKKEGSIDGTVGIVNYSWLGAGKPHHMDLMESNLGPMSDPDVKLSWRQFDLHWIRLKVEKISLFIRRFRQLWDAAGIPDANVQGITKVRQMQQKQREKKRQAREQKEKQKREAREKKAAEEKRKQKEKEAEEREAREKAREAKEKEAKEKKKKAKEKC